jgi:competence protein ComEC
MAHLILEVARTVGEWPQLGATETAALAAVAGLAWWARVRWAAAVAVAVVALVAAMPPGPPAEPTVVFLDVGQGDAVLLLDPSGAVMLMDGGRDPGVLRDGLRRYGVKHIDLLVASHGDADHVGGLAELASSIPIGRLWVPDYASTGAILDDVIDEARQRGVPVDLVGAGDSAHLGGFSLEVLGPARRYATDNDGSVVLFVSAAGHTVLLPGDIEATAQRSIGPQHPDILLVPHHGAGTTDPDWLAETLGPVAVVSVGPNTYGHPAPETMEVLDASSTEVHTTWEEGDVVVPLS